MTPDELLARATRFEFPIDEWRAFDAVAVETRGPGHDGATRWAVCYGGQVLSTDRARWDYEPMPSNRTDDWLDQFRFRDVIAACDAAKAAAAELRAEREDQTP